MLLLVAAGFFLNIYVVKNKWLHILAIVAFFTVLFIGSHYLHASSKWMRVAFYVTWGGELIVFVVYTMMTIMFSYPPR